MNIIEEKLALKELVDVFSNLADVKDTDTQALLFTEDAELNSYRGEELVSALKGREDIKNACAEFLALFDTVYHCNGQQVVKVEDNKATGIAYCNVVLIGMEDGKRVMTTQGVRYDDEYVKIDEKWLIAKRTSYFVYVDKKSLKRVYNL